MVCGRRATLAHSAVAARGQEPMHAETLRQKQAPMAAASNTDSDMMTQSTISGDAVLGPAPRECPQCGANQWQHQEYQPNFWTIGRGWRCEACQFETWCEYDELAGRVQRGERWARCRCCGQVMHGSGARTGYGPRCRSGRCGCHVRRLNREVRLMRKTLRQVMR